MLPGQPGPEWLPTADTLGDLAKLVGINAKELPRTVTRFNAGEDDFHRGGTMYERAFGDPTVAHPNLGPISEPPFFALPVYPGSVGTKGGARTDDQHDRRWRHYRVRTGVGADRRGLTVHYGRTRSGTSLMRQRSWA
ncbi:hypothetical protein GCM10029964_036440 [Kibdelosporangium lantanae]